MKKIENIVWKGENAGNHHFLFEFPKCFLPSEREVSTFNLLPATASNLDNSKDYLGKSSSKL